MNKPEPVILLDCDGVLADFVGAVVNVLRDYSSLKWSHESFKQWDIFADVVDPKQPYLKELLIKRIERKSFCKAIKPFHHAKDAVNLLRNYGDVKVITAPWKGSKHWMPEREEWLVDHFGFKHREIVFAADKSGYIGDIMVDDRGSNLKEWKKVMHRHGIDARPFLWDTNQNKDTTGLTRISEWKELLFAVEGLIAERDS